MRQTEHDDVSSQREEFVLKLFRSRNQVRMMLDAAFKPSGVTDATWRVLFYLYRSTEAVLQKDIALELGIDWLALSFVQRPDDVTEARELLGDHRVAVMAKVEKTAAVKRFDEILDVVDGIMVARGDLGVEMMSWELPAIQKQMIRRCRQVGKIVRAGKRTR